MRIMGLDVGEKTIGIALSDENSIIASPFSTIGRRSVSKDFEDLKRIISEQDVAIIVVGMPINMDGTVGKRADSVNRFIGLLRGFTGLQVHPWDERFSTKAVERVLIDGDLSRHKRKKVVDKLAASYILQGYLDSIAGASTAAAGFLS